VRTLPRNETRRAEKHRSDAAYKPPLRIAREELFSNNFHTMYYNTNA
jgi:hypothetical protein